MTTNGQSHGDGGRQGAPIDGDRLRQWQGANVRVRLVDGHVVYGEVAGYDDRCLEVVRNGAPQLVYWHAVAVIEPEDPGAALHAAALNNQDGEITRALPNPVVDPHAPSGAAQAPGATAGTPGVQPPTVTS